MRRGFKDTGREITSDAILVVEGDAEFHFLVRLLTHTGLEGRIDIRPPYQDIAPLTEYVRDTVVITPGFDRVKRLGVMRDAEEVAVQSVLGSVSDALNSAFPGAPRLTQAGHWVDHRLDASRTVRLGAFVSVPCLEQLCLSPAKVETDPAMLCVDAYVECLASHVADRTRAQQAKRQLHAYLASREEPGLQIGYAADRGYFDFDDVCWHPLKQFLHQLAKP